MKSGLKYSPKKSPNYKRGLKKFPEYSFQVDLKDYADSEGYEPGFVTGKIMSDKRLVIYVTWFVDLCEQDSSMPISALCLWEDKVDSYPYF